MLVVLGFAGGLLYKVDYVHKKKIGQFSLIQILYLIVIPGILFPMAFSYALTLMGRPMSNQTIFSDKLLLNIILLAILFTYGGMAIHAVTKQLSKVITPYDDDIYRVNSYFHLTLSHNMSYSGAILAVFGFTMLELNHIPAGDPVGWMWAIARGLLLGVGLMLAVFNYRPYTTSRWSDLKTFFLVIWLVMVVMIYATARVRPSIDEYQLLFPSLLSFSLIALLSLVIVVRRVRRGWRVRVRKTAFEHYIRGEDVD